MSNNTFGYIRKRILDALSEYTDDSCFVLTSDTDKASLSGRIPDAVTSSLVRMYESLDMGVARGYFDATKFIPVSYIRTVSEKSTQFETDINEAALVFLCSGRGSIIITNEVGEECERIVHEGGSEIVRRSLFVTLSGKRYNVYTEGFITVRDFTVYEKKKGVDIMAYAPFGFMSICLPKDFSSFEKIMSDRKEIFPEDIEMSEEYAYIPASFEMSGNLFAVYRKKSPVISSDTDDEYSFDLSPLAVEALIYLSASELCRENDAQRYTRFIYKYTDLCEALRTPSRVKRNTFFTRARRMRWR